jgi:hypothetical protein
LSCYTWETSPLNFREGKIILLYLIMVSDNGMEVFFSKTLFECGWVNHFDTPTTQEI